jgi:short-subunit dehydrogenase
MIYTMVITGAASGIGKAFAYEGNKRHFNLALIDMDREGLNTLHKDLQAQNEKSKITIHEMDVSDPHQWEKTANEIKFQHSEVSLLINNAGITLSPTAFSETDPGLFDKVLDINLMGALYGIRNILPLIDEKQGNGIINMVSLAGLMGLYGYSSYSMSKMALRGLGESLQMEFAGTELHCLNVFPGGVKTNIMKNALDLNNEKAGLAHKGFQSTASLTPEKVAAKSLSAFEKKRASIILGIDAKIIFSIKKLFRSSANKILKAIFEKQIEFNTRKGEKE